MADVIFDVVGRSKTEKITKEGNRETVFKVSLKSTNGKMKLSISSGDSGLLQEFPLNSAVPVKIGTSNQKTLSDVQIKQELKEAENTSQEDDE
jgi:propanediol dehydratase small subunit